MAIKSIGLCSPCGELFDELRNRPANSFRADLEAGAFCADCKPKIRAVTLQVLRQADADANALGEQAVGKKYRLMQAEELIAIWNEWHDTGKIRKSRLDGKKPPLALMRDLDKLADRERDS